MVDYWLSKGASADKLVVGMAFYGKSLKLLSADKHDVGDQKVGAGTNGPFTNLPGFVAYYEVRPYQHHAARLNVQEFLWVWLSDKPASVDAQFAIM